MDSEKQVLGRCGANYVGCEEELPGEERRVS
jgi:hypothetical protein